MDILGALISSQDYMTIRLRAKLSECRSLLNSLDDILNARMKIHLHRVTTSACCMQHLFKLVLPRLSYFFAKKFDKDQMHASSKYNELPVSLTTATQIWLRRTDGGHGSTSLARVVHASYAARPIVSAPLRITDPSIPNLRQELYLG